MVEGFITNQEKLEFKQIVLQHLKKILELSTSEFHGGFNKTIQQGNAVSREYVLDNRKGYIQSIESLARVLLPHFDDLMKKHYSNYKEELKKLAEELNGIKLGRTIFFSNDKIQGVQADKVYTRSKLEMVHELFEQLNLLLKRIDYLNKAVYIEEEEPELEDIDK